MIDTVPVTIEHLDVSLEAFLAVPDQPRGLIIFAHGSGSGRHSPRNSHVAAGLNHAGFATLLIDLLTLAEEADRSNVFDIELLASRLKIAVEWAANQAELRALPVGLFGASTGAGAALLAAAQMPEAIKAVVSRGGRPDLAGHALVEVAAPTLLLVGGNDGPVIDLNRDAADRLNCSKALVIIPNAGHLFEEEGALDMVLDDAVRWFAAYLEKDPAA
ncbi:dienelactone hydrolase family protein [Sphingomonas edaphi]|uniref:Alpha/beta hydrolase n=1 Tax=Sphingomonas edaphi TaxID=2315689 RepID=A0A418PZ12_9SPHN|nr:alpha/beta hydrolase [Sphingomonas edaphi]RIX27401.1 alpha/beta hydrolase [Sphingomonas edaphi]